MTTHRTGILSTAVDRSRQGSRAAVLDRLEPVEPGDSGDSADGVNNGRGLGVAILAVFSEVRRRWRLVALSWLLVFTPIALCALTAVPTYTSSGVVQVSSEGSLSGANPLLELAGGAASAEVNTEVQIFKRRDFLVEVFKGLRLHVIDPSEPHVIATDPDVFIGGSSPVDPRLVSMREALGVVVVPPGRFEAVELLVDVVDDETVSITVDPDAAAEVAQVRVGELFEHDAVKLRFDQTPLPPGERMRFRLLGDGALLEDLAARVGVSALGTVREPTNLVQISFTSTDRFTSQAVVQRILDDYLQQSLTWQTHGASQSAAFIRERLEEAEEQLTQAEEELRAFAQGEGAVQLDTQARVTIEKAAEIEAARLQLDLQSQVLGNMISRIKRSGATRSADLTANLLDDPVLGAAVAALTEAESKYVTARSAVTADHPQVTELAARIELQRKEVGRLLKTARKNLSAKTAQLDRRLEEASGALASYPRKELQLARLMRDVEVSRRLYAFLLEKKQEAEILEASTTTDKRQIDVASLPHRRTSPKRASLLGTGAMAALGCALALVYLTRLFQRKVPTVAGVREIAPYPSYGTIPLLARKDGEDRLRPCHLWDQAHSDGAESFRALCVNVSLAPAEAGRGRIIQLTSSHPGEGKSTIAANLAAALAKSGGRVLVADLDLRKPVQHRIWQLPRSPGYADVIAQGGASQTAGELKRTVDDWGLDVLAAGTRLPDTLASVMTPALPKLLEHWAKHYDYVIVDGAPAFVADASVLSKHADLVLLVARPGVVERGQLCQAVEMLARVDASKGLVFNGVTRSNTDYYYYGGGYSYADSGDEEADSANQPPRRQAG